MAAVYREVGCCIVDDSVDNPLGLGDCAAASVSTPIVVESSPSVSATRAPASVFDDIADTMLDESWHAGSIWEVFLASLFAPFAFRAVLDWEKKNEAVHTLEDSNVENDAAVQAKSVQLADPAED